MKLAHLAVLLALICVIFGNIQVTELPDSMATTLSENTRQMIRVEKKAAATSDHYVHGTFYKTYPQLAMEFELPFSQFVNIHYHISLTLNVGSFLITRLFIDDKEDTDFRCVNGYQQYTNVAFSQVFLTKGIHYVKVIYRTNSASTVYIPLWDWATAYLKVRYYKPGELIQNPNIPKKMTKTVRASDDYYLVQNNKWQQFSNLILTLELQYDQQIEINYKIITATNPECFLATQIKIDGEVSQTFGSLSWKSDLHKIEVFGRKTWLKKGAHFFQLEYKTQGTRDMEKGKEFQVAFVEIVYHQTK